MNRACKQLTRFSRVSYRDIGVWVLTVLAMVNLLGSVALAGTMVYARVITGHWMWPW